MTRQNKYNRRWMASQKEKGLCVFCKNIKLPESDLCERHYFVRTAINRLKNSKMADNLEMLWRLQKGCCYLTGRKLVLGLNASIDHVAPRSKGGKVTSIQNVRWCDKQINLLKRDFTLDELLSLCKEILDHKPFVNLIRVDQTNHSLFGTFCIPE
jgi:hypothetical protein